MGRTARERLARLLDDAEVPGAFSAQILAPADALQVEVDGVGVVQAPVRAPLAKKLIAVGRPAKFGRGEQTLTDTSVRDTWEITPDLVTLAGPVWEATLGSVLDGVRDELGLPPTTRLRAEVHAMPAVTGTERRPSAHPESETTHRNRIGELRTDTEMPKPRGIGVGDEPISIASRRRTRTFAPAAG